jgi:hypothetical protein
MRHRWLAVAMSIAFAGPAHAHWPPTPAVPSETLRTTLTIDLPAPLCNTVLLGPQEEV